MVFDTKWISGLASMKQSWVFMNDKGNHDQKNKAYPWAWGWASQEDSQCIKRHRQKQTVNPTACVWAFKGGMQVIILVLSIYAILMVQRLCFKTWLRNFAPFFLSLDKWVYQVAPYVFWMESQSNEVKSLGLHSRVQTRPLAIKGAPCEIRRKL